MPDSLNQQQAITHYGGQKTAEKQINSIWLVFSSPATFKKDFYPAIAGVDKFRQLPKNILRLAKIRPSFLPIASEKNSGFF